jgi:hypothetical protein
VADDEAEADGLNLAMAIAAKWCHRPSRHAQVAQELLAIFASGQAHIEET